MAAILVTTIKRFLGTAAEMAALSTTGLPAGSTFQTDTGLLYVLDSGGSWNVKKITAVNATHDSLNVNANMQVGDTDVGAANPVPTTLSGSNVEGTPSGALPSKAVYVGFKDSTGMNLLSPHVVTGLGGYNDGESSNSKIVLPVAATISAYNGSSVDRWRNNTEGTLLASAARTADILSPTQTNYNAKAVQVFLNVTAVSGTGGLTVYIATKDPVSGTGAYLLQASVAVTGTGQYIYELGLGASGTAGQKVKVRLAGMVPRTWYVIIAHGDASSYTYSVGYSLLV